jgi:hypothetical protein
MVGLDPPQEEAQMEWWQIQELMWTATGIFAVLIVVSGFTLRFAIKPFLRDLHELRESRRSEPSWKAARKSDWTASKTSSTVWTGPWNGSWKCPSSTAN